MQVLEDLREIDVLKIENLADLESLAGLEALQEANEIRIAGNPKLSSCEVQAFVERFPDAEVLAVNNLDDGCE